MKRVPFSEPLWRPEPFLGCEDRDHRERVVLALSERKEEPKPALSVVALAEPEFRVGYMARLRAKIKALAEPEVVDFRGYREVKR